VEEQPIAIGVDLVGVEGDGADRAGVEEFPFEHARAAAVIPGILGERTTLGKLILAMRPMRSGNRPPMDVAGRYGHLLASRSRAVRGATAWKT